MNNILFVGHDIEYLNFYMNISNNFKNTNSFHAYIRPSAELYSKLINNNTLNLITSRFKEFDFCNKNLLQVNDLKFYTNGFEDQIREKEFILLFNKYIKVLDEFIIKNEINKIVTSGEYRLFEQAVIHCAKKNKIELIFFEAGPPGYVYFDKNGVNANVIFKSRNKKSEISDDSFKKKETLSNFISFKKNEIFKKLFIIFEVLYLFLLLFFNYMIDYIEYYQALKNRIIKYSIFLKSKFLKFKKTKIISRIDEEFFYFLYLDQVKSDVNYTHFSNFNNSENMLHDFLNDNVNNHIKWRFHPLQKQSRLYDSISKKFPEQVTVDNSNSLRELILGCQAGITVNSNAGLECLSYGKKLLLLGDSYYECCKGVMKDYRDLIKQTDSNDIIDDYNKFLSENFLSIDYRNSKFDKGLMLKLGDYFENEI